MNAGSRDLKLECSFGGDMNSNPIHFTNKITLTVAAALALGMAAGSNRSLLAAAGPGAVDQPRIEIIDPPERDFYSKMVDYHGIKIKAHKVVADEALFEAWRRVDMLLTNLPMVLTNLVAAGAELHIIGKDQVTTDLPEWRQDKHVPLDDYSGLTRDVRTRGMGGLVASFGEENLLRLSTDRYYDRAIGVTRDICIHEFSHGVFGSGLPQSVRQMFLDQLRRSLDKGLWVNSYAASGTGGEFLSEITMWYWGSHGDLSMQGAKPENGREGLRKYDPDTFKLVDDYYNGRIEIAKVEPRFRRPTGGTNSVAGRPAGGTNSFAGRTPRDSLQARTIVAKLTSYKTGETKLKDFYTDAGIAGPGETSTNGWHVITRDGVASDTNAVAAADGTLRLRVLYRDTRPAGAGRGGRAGAGPGGRGPGATNQTATVPSVQSTNTAAAQGTNAVAGPGARGARGGMRGEPSLADLDFKDGVLAVFKWNN
jgi:hypothetical protein